MNTLGLWIIRGVIWSAFGATVWFAGPRALRVAEARTASLRAPSGAFVALDRVSLGAEPPAWLRGPLLRAVLRDLQPELNGSIRIMDDPGVRELEQRLQALPWVLAARAERRFPDRFRVELGLRRPVLELVSVSGELLAWLDGDGTALPPLASGQSSGLPTTQISIPALSALPDPLPMGVPVGDATVVAAAKVAREWLESVADSVEGAPALLSVDARNLGWRLVKDPEISQVVVTLAVGGGVDGAGSVDFHYGLAADDGGPVPPATKAWVLNSILSEYPGLHGLRRGDLRRRNLWRHCLVPSRADSTSQRR